MPGTYLIALSAQNKADSRPNYDLHFVNLSSVAAQARSKETSRRFRFARSESLPACGEQAERTKRSVMHTYAPAEPGRARPRRAGAMVGWLDGRRYLDALISNMQEQSCYCTVLQTPKRMCARCEIKVSKLSIVLLVTHCLHEATVLLLAVALASHGLCFLHPAL